MRRREFITLLGAAAAMWPLEAPGQQAGQVIGFLSARSPGDSADSLAGFRRGLKEGGFVEGQNVVIEFRWANGEYGRLPQMAAELVRRQVNVIAAVGGELSGVAANRGRPLGKRAVTSSGTHQQRNRTFDAGRVCLAAMVKHRQK
jgi:putative tryptophan/tyrosine transport system substrate-binding protein